jgi:dephospho-CoA kinase
MKRVAITGAQGSGKTYISMRFAALGVPVLIIDQVVKQLQSSNLDVISKTKKRFPMCFVNDQMLHETFRKILFFDNTGKNLKDLADILRPHLLEEFNKFCDEHSNKKWVLIESALIYEYKVEDLFDEIIFVKSDTKMRKRMAIKRDGITSKEYDMRMKSQLSDEYKIEKSQWVIQNDYTDKVYDSVDKIFEMI